VGYSQRAKGFRVSTSHVSIAESITLSQQFVADVKGTWVGGVIPVASGRNFDVRVEGGYLISSTTGLTEEDDTTLGFGGQTWTKAVVDSYFLDAQGAYRLSEAWGLVGGFRWDVVSLKVSNPELQFYQGIPGWESDISVNSYEPYVGLEVVQGSRTAGKLRMQVVGFPALFGNVRFGDSFPNTFLPSGVARYDSTAKSFKNGYFGEVLADYSLGVFGSGSIGLFGRMAFFHGNSTGNTERSAQDIVAPPYVGSASADIAYDRSIFILGGSFSMAFDMPF